MDKFIYETIPLNKHLCNIIFQYNDHNLESLIKTFKLNKYKDDDILNYEQNLCKNISLVDLMMTCLKMGFKGIEIFGEEEQLFYKRFIKHSNHDFEKDKTFLKRMKNNVLQIYLNTEISGHSIRVSEVITYIYYCEYKC